VGAEDTGAVVQDHLFADIIEFFGGQGFGSDTGAALGDNPIAVVIIIQQEETSAPPSTGAGSGPGGKFKPVPI